MRLFNRGWSLILLGLCLAFLTTPATAYIDGGTGSMVFQAAIAGLLGAAFAVRSCWGSVLATIRRKSNARKNKAEL